MRTILFWIGETIRLIAIGTVSGIVCGFLALAAVSALHLGPRADAAATSVSYAHTSVCGERTCGHP